MTLQEDAYWAAHQKINGTSHEPKHNSMYFGHRVQQFGEYGSCHSCGKDTSQSNQSFGCTAPLHAISKVKY